MSPIVVRPIAAEDSLPLLTDLIHAAYAPHAARGLRYWGITKRSKIRPNGFNLGRVSSLKSAAKYWEPLRFGFRSLSRQSLYIANRTHGALASSPCGQVIRAKASASSCTITHWLLPYRTALDVSQSIPHPPRQRSLRNTNRGVTKSAVSAIGVHIQTISAFSCRVH